jgi:quinol-cytochrome oxidoreductase complex cytochrome b subunit
VCLFLLGVAFLVLAVSGAWLWFKYRPTAAAAFPTIRTRPRSSSWVRTVHRVASGLTVVLALSTLVLLIGRRIRARGRGVVAGLAVLATGVAAAFTGYLLPWDQLALWAVTVGKNVSGVRAVFGATVKYVLVDGREVSPGTYRFWAIAHVTLGVLVAAAGVLAWLRTRPQPTPAPADELVRSS